MAPRRLGLPEAVKTDPKSGNLMRFDDILELFHGKFMNNSWEITGISGFHGNVLDFVGLVDLIGIRES